MKLVFIQCSCKSLGWSFLLISLANGLYIMQGFGQHACFLYRSQMDRRGKPCSTKCGQPLPLAVSKTSEMFSHKHTHIESRHHCCCTTMCMFHPPIWCFRLITAFLMREEEIAPALHKHIQTQELHCESCLLFWLLYKRSTRLAAESHLAEFPESIALTDMLRYKKCCVLDLLHLHYTHFCII